MRKLIKKILKESEQDNFEWAEDVVSKHPKIYTTFGVYMGYDDNPNIFLGISHN